MTTHHRPFPRATPPTFHWHLRCPTTWPTWAQTWAQKPGSLTLHLQALEQNFTVQLVQQSLAHLTYGPEQPPQHLSAGLPHTSHTRTMHQRLVRLQLGGSVVVAAQTLIPWQGPCLAWPVLRGLGSQSLGTVLFGKPVIGRNVVYYARWLHTPRWLTTALPSNLLPPTACPLGPPWYVRCAAFTHTRPQGRLHGVPLWVVEVFLPTLQNHT